MLIGVTVWYGVNVRQAVRFIPLKGDAYGYGFEAMLFNGVLVAAGLAMIVPLFIPSRWRGPVPDADEPGRRGPGQADADLLRLGRDRADNPDPAKRPLAAVTLRTEPRQWNCALSVEPASAIVSALGEIAWVTRSK